MAFIRSFLQDHGFPPTIREIGNAVKISSTSVVNYNLNRLVERGYLRREKDVSRGLRLAEDSPDLVPAGGFIRIQLAGSIKAGEPVEIYPDAFDEEDAIELSRDMLPQHDNVFALRVSGDSMIDAMINDGDVVIMKPQTEARNGEMVAAWLSDRQETTLKYFFYEGGQVRLQPASPDPIHKTIYVDPEIIQIRGKVLMVVRQLG